MESRLFDFCQLSGLVLKSFAKAANVGNMEEMCTILLIFKANSRCVVVVNISFDFSCGVRSSCFEQSKSISNNI